jgi:hypothetical protein
MLYSVFSCSKRTPEVLVGPQQLGETRVHDRERRGEAPSVRGRGEEVCGDWAGPLN